LEPVCRQAGLIIWNLGFDYLEFEI
jgi:hypothetical protein